MRFNLVSVSLLCFITRISSIYATNGPAVSNCCLGWSTTIAPVKKIVNYTVQGDDICPIKAIVFRTEAGKTICSDPNSGWAKKARQEMDKTTGVLQNNQQNEEGSTSNITPALMSTMPKNAWRKKGHRKRKRQLRKNVKRGRKCY